MTNYRGGKESTRLGKSIWARNGLGRTCARGERKRNPGLAGAGGVVKNTSTKTVEKCVTQKTKSPRG